MAWAKATNLETGEVHYDSTPDALDRTVYSVQEIVDNRAPGALEEVSDTGELYVVLEALQASTWRKVKAKRSNLEESVAPTPFGRVEIDEKSQVRIERLVGRATRAKADGRPFAESFTFADNSVSVLTADDMISLGDAVGTYISEVFAHARGLRASIFAPGATVAAVSALKIGTGWPSIAVRARKRKA